MAEAEAERVREAARVAESQHESNGETVHPPAQHPPSSAFNNPRLLTLYNATLRDGQLEFLAEMERGGGIEALQAIVIRWMMTATAGAHVNA